MYPGKTCPKPVRVIDFSVVGPSPARWVPLCPYSLPIGYKCPRSSSCPSASLTRSTRMVTATLTLLAARRMTTACCQKTVTAAGRPTAALMFRPPVKVSQWGEASSDVSQKQWQMVWPCFKSPLMLSTWVWPDTYSSDHLTSRTAICYNLHNIWDFEKSVRFV